MVRIDGLLEATVLSLVPLLVFGCAQAAQPRTTPALPAPALPPLAGGDMQTQARQIVLTALTDPDPQIRANAVEVVATTKELRLMPKVQKLLQDESIPVRFLAVVAVGDLEYRLAADDVAKLLEDPNPNIKVAASYAMMKLGRPEYYKVICNAVASSDQTVRANAALLLGKSGRREGLRFLYWTLQRGDSADKVILQAAESIAMLGDHRIYPKLWTRLISAYADDRVIGIRAMGALGTDEAKSALITMLDDGVPEVRLAAAEQLGRLREPAGAAEVQAVFEQDLVKDLDAQSQARIKTLAALAIGEIGTDKLLRHLPPLLQDPAPPVRLAAAKASLQWSRH